MSKKLDTAEKRAKFLEERMINREKSRALKFYNATKSTRGLSPKMKRPEALREILKAKKDLTTEEAVRFCDEVIKKIEKEIKDSSKKR